MMAYPLATDTGIAEGLSSEGLVPALPPNGGNEQLGRLVRNFDPRPNSISTAPQTPNARRP